MNLSSGLMVLFALHGLSACGKAVTGGDGDGDGDSASGGEQSTGGAATGGSPSTGGFQSSGGAPPAGGGMPNGGMNQGGEDGVGGGPGAMGGESSQGTGGFVFEGFNCPNELPSGDCELGSTFSCQGWIYPYVTPFCDCLEADGFDEPQWYCAL